MEFRIAYTTLSTPEIKIGMRIATLPKLEIIFGIGSTILPKLITKVRMSIAILFMPITTLRGAQTNYWVTVTINGMPDLLYALYPVNFRELTCLY